MCRRRGLKYSSYLVNRRRPDTSVIGTSYTGSDPNGLYQHRLGVVGVAIGSARAGGGLPYRRSPRPFENDRAKRGVGATPAFSTRVSNLNPTIQTFFFAFALCDWPPTARTSFSHAHGPPKLSWRNPLSAAGCRH